MIPTCHTCKVRLSLNKFYLVAELSSDNETINWVVVCQDHANGWYDNSDINGPTFRLKINPLGE